MLKIVLSGVYLGKTIWLPASSFSQNNYQNIRISSIYTNIAWIYRHRIIARHEINTIQVCVCFFMLLLRQNSLKSSMFTCAFTHFMTFHCYKIRQ